MLEKTVNELRMKLVDLETRSYKGGSGENSFLAKRIQDVSSQHNVIDVSWRKNYKIANVSFPKIHVQIVI